MKVRDLRVSVASKFEFTVGETSRSLCNIHVEYQATKCFENNTRLFPSEPATGVELFFIEKYSI